MFLLRSVGYILSTPYHTLRHFLASNTLYCFMTLACL